MNAHVPHLVQNAVRCSLAWIVGGDTKLQHIAAVASNVDTVGMCGFAHEQAKEMVWAYF